ncbi:hypothetical protein RHGRI_018784 [Rhododendron griersonianum]|uniref:Phytocyanin domain-containing protein n=1 Tax=Rhododendron griersonianum TaxID=479676 RepID=A0AAV6K2Z3_9ERIC|nr:hypothetical protein RHGRI_018784 [Rhododendron griersonianum]
MELPSDLELDIVRRMDEPSRRAMRLVSTSWLTAVQRLAAKGWAKPTGNDSETYNEWASPNRFHVGDEALFKYQKDSVLVVSKEDYENCITSNPISKFADGNTVFAFDHFGFFYFISGQTGHCKSGQRLIIRVMVQSEVEPPQNTTTPPPLCWILNIQSSN